MNTIDCIKSRRSVRKFTEEKVPHEVLEQLVELARWAPSWKNTQIARYVAVEDEALKNRIAEEAGLGELTAHMYGTSAFAYSPEDPIAAAKILNKFAESHKDKFDIRAGYMDGKVLDEAGVIAVAKLPGKQELLTMLCMALNGNIRGLAVALDAIREKKEGEAA